jgi:multidrug efflux pump subunit AcrA (membrane-fusion protein)
MSTANSSNPHGSPLGETYASASHPGVGAAGGDLDQVENARQEIRQLVQEIARLAQQNLPPSDFYQGFLSRTISALAAVGGAVWEPRGESFHLAYQIDAPWDAATQATGMPSHAIHLERVAASNQALAIPPRSGDGGSLDNPTPHLLLLAPLVCDGRCLGVVEIAQRPGGGLATQRGYMRFLVQMCDLAADYLKTRRLRDLEQRDELWGQIAPFLRKLQHAFDLLEIAYAVANDGRRIIGCDRLSFLFQQSGRATTQAVSGLDALDRRAAQVQRLEQLTAAVLRGQKPLIYPTPEELPPQIQQPLEDYLDLSHARALAIYPLHEPETDADAASPQRITLPPLGALAIEQLQDEVFAPATLERATCVTNHAAAALARACEYRRIPLLGFWRALDRTGWRSLTGGLRLVFGAAAAALIVAALAFIPAELEVAARGKLQPVKRREIFAQLDGVVEKVYIRHGQQVRAGELLLELSNHDLREQLTALLGRRETTRERISALERTLLSGKSSNERLSSSDENRLSGELFELRQEAANQDRELAIFREKEAQLQIVADSDGRVLTWKAEELLTRRPVQLGQALLTLVDPAGPWELELLVPERRLKHLTGAQQLQVRFTLASYPGQEFAGTVIELEQTAEVRGEDGNTVRLRVQIDKSQLPNLHDQVTVAARIQCGPAPIGYVWFRDLIETIQTRILFWF